jgi:hypothetical protein
MAGLTLLLRTEGIEHALKVAHKRAILDGLLAAQKARNILGPYAHEDCPGNILRFDIRADGALALALLREVQCASSATCLPAGDARGVC